MDLYPGIQPEEIIRALWGPDDLGAAADHPAMKLAEKKPEDFERGVRRGFFLHPPVAVPSPPLGLLGLTLSASILDHSLVYWEYIKASWMALKPAWMASKQAGRASEPVVRTSETIGRASEPVRRTSEQAGRAFS